MYVHIRYKYITLYYSLGVPQLLGRIKQECNVPVCASWS